MSSKKKPRIAFKIMIIIYALYEAVLLDGAYDDPEFTWRGFAIISLVILALFFVAGWAMYRILKNGQE